MSLPSDPIGAFANQPQDLNFLTNHRFQLMVQRLPTVRYFSQGANIPGLSMGNAVQATPFTDIPRPGDKVQFAPFTISFAVDQQLKNWKEIGKWITGLGFPKDYGQFADLDDSQDGIYSDISLFVLDAKWNPQHMVTFRNAFPISITGIDFDTKVSDTQIVYAQATFLYGWYDFEEVDEDSDTITPADVLNG